MADEKRYSTEAVDALLDLLAAGQSPAGTDWDEQLDLRAAAVRASKVDNAAKLAADVALIVHATDTSLSADELDWLVFARGRGYAEGFANIPITPLLGLEQRGLIERDSVTRADRPHWRVTQLGLDFVC